MGYLIKSHVINALEEDKESVMMCYEGKERKDIIAFCYESMKQIIEVLPQYWPENMIEGIGLNLEQIRELAERDTAKAPDYEGDGCDDKGNMIYDTWICPNCRKKYEVDYDNYDFCPSCGQRLKLDI